MASSANPNLQNQKSKSADQASELHWALVCNNITQIEFGSNWSFFVFVFVLVASGLWGFEWRLRASGGCGFWWWLGQWWGISMEAVVIPYFLLTLQHLALLTFCRS